MKRIRGNNEPLKRIKAGSEPICADASGIIERVKVKPDRVYNGGYVKDKETGLLIKNGELYKYIDGCYFKCWPDGNLKDQKTETHCCWFGKITKLASDDELRKVSMSVTRQMIKCFPGTYFDLTTGERKQASDEDGMIVNRKLI